MHVELRRLLHEWNIDLGVGVDLEWPLARRIFGERALPASLEVDSVGKNQAGIRRHDSRRQQILDALPGLLLNPVVDGLACAFGITLEVDELEAGAVIVADCRQEAIEKAEILLTPESIGRDEVVLPLLGLDLAIEPRDQRRVRRMEKVLAQREVEGLGDLLLGVAARSSPGHPEPGRDAVGREEQIA